MKKSLLILGLLIAALLAIASITNRTQPGTSAPPLDTKISCEPAEPVPNAMPFDPDASAPRAIMIRRNIYNLSAAEISSINTGIAAMQSLPTSDPTSWTYQAAIHRTTLTGSFPSWNSCQHGTQFFFSWHRMYLYFFERILRAKSGNPNLTLPYWNYQTNPVLHPAYRNNAVSNKLYDGTRNATINSGGPIGPGPLTAIQNAMNDIAFFDFQSSIEGPHGSIHVLIGGNMGSVPTAAKDPVFWLHHTNIDRLWEEWLRKCGGRSNPTENNTWMNQEFTFFDENGKAVRMTGRQIVNTAASLNYNYDLPPAIKCDFRLEWWKWRFIRYRLIRYPINLPLKKLEKVSFQKANTDSLQLFLKNEGATQPKLSGNAQTDRLWIELEDVNVQTPPQGVVEVYLNLRDGEKPDPTSSSFVGVLDLFTLSGHKSHSNKNIQRLNASIAARKLGLKLNQLANANLVFYTRGNTISKKEAPFQSGIKIGSINIVVEKISK